MEKGTSITSLETRYSNSVLSRIKNLIRDSIYSLWL